MFTCRTTIGYRRCSAALQGHGTLQTTC